jgi:peptidoglycan/xylan/chitin deacetylase (PgdA/CDA1 family)
MPPIYNPIAQLARPGKYDGMKTTHRFLIATTLILSACSAVPSSTPASASNETPLVFKNTTVSLTFDDGDADNYLVRETLAVNHLHATFYIVSGLIGKDGYMTVEQLHDLYSDGNEIGGHSLNHRELPKLDSAEMRREICQDRLNLLAFGFSVTSFAYPYGRYDDESKQTVQDCGYNSARAVTHSPDTIPPGDMFLVHALPYIVTDTPMSRLIRQIRAMERRGGGWAILVFHHICYRCDRFSTTPELFAQFAGWLNEQQDNGLTIKTVGQVIGGETQPGVNP